MQRETLNCDAVAAKASANATGMWGSARHCALQELDGPHGGGPVIVSMLQAQRLRLGEVIQRAHCEELGLRLSLAASQNPELTSAL